MTTAVDPHGSWDLQSRLNEIAGDVEKPGYYLSGEGQERWEGTGDGMSLYIYVGANFCEPCIDLIEKLLERQHVWNEETKEWEDVEIEIGGLAGSESESSNFCFWCGEKLETNLTMYGAAEERSHYEENPPTMPLRPADACDLSNILSGLDPDEPTTPEFVAKVGGWLAEHDEAVRKEEVTTE